MASKPSAPSMAQYEQYYAILEIMPGATEKEVTTAYRSRALKLHPDKNRSDPKAQERFLKLREAYEILLDPEARRVYEHLLHLRKERQRMQAGLDGRRKVLQEELLEREREARRQEKGKEEAEAALLARLERLREETMRVQREKRMNKAVFEASQEAILLVKTSASLYLVQETLLPFDPAVKIIGQPPELTAIFSDLASADTILHMSQSGQLPSQLQFSWLHGRRPEATPPKPVTRLDAGKVSMPKEAASEGFEASVLEKLRLAQLKKRQKQDQ